MRKHIYGFLLLFSIGTFSTLNAQLIDQDDPTLKAQTIATDLIVLGSECVGLDCSSAESFGFDTERLKENNLRIHFDDTSSSASFPSNDWRIVINDSSNGGASYFSIEDATAGRTPFRVNAGAIANAMVIDSEGDVGIGTATPVVEVHTVDGNTPTVRLDQDGSSGFTPQVWDMAGNETNFFIRNVTGGSKLPFRIRPGAPDDNLYLDNDGKIGIKTAAPAAAIHAVSTGEAALKLEDATDTSLDMILESTNATRQDLTMNFNNVDRQWLVQARKNAGFRIQSKTTSGNFNAININGSTQDITTAGDITANSVALTSDMRLKTDVEPFSDGLSLVRQLNPISYNFNGEAGFYTKKRHYSISAQELQKAAPHLVGTFEYEEEDNDGNILNAKEYLKINFSAMTWVLVNSIKEQQDQIEGLEEQVKEVETLKTEITALQAQLDEIKALLESGSSTQSATVNGGSALKQNYPNPHDGLTNIEYTVPENSVSAQLKIFDAKGGLLKTITLDKGQGNVQLNTKELANGNYSYSLFIDGKLKETKKMTQVR